MWTPNNKEIVSVLTLSPSERYKYFVKKVADENTVWSLRHADGWALASNDEGASLVPVWPHPSYAEICAGGNWADYGAVEIPLSVWLDRWIPGMLKDARQVAVFPTDKNQGIAIGPKRLDADLREELSYLE
jgi:hypothetical protein